MGDATPQFVERIRAAAASKTLMRFRGGGSKDFYGQLLQGDLLDTREHAGIINYEPTELVITARCGTSLREIESVLAERGQVLAFEPPHFGEHATLGGMVAAGLSGPRRASAGAVRDYVLGVKMLDGKGEVLSFGGQVMKNVAGYDVSRLMAGSLGTLGLILEVSLKTLPVPAAEITLKLSSPEASAIDLMNQWAGKPLPISATAWTGGDLSVRLSGAVAAVEAAAGKIGGDRLTPDQAEKFWSGIREQTDPYFCNVIGAGAKLNLWRLSVPSTTPPLDLPGEQLIEWGGALRWLVSNDDAKAIRDVTAKAGGQATLFRSEDKSCGAFAPLTSPLSTIHQRLKQAFDPAGIFNSGRMYADF